MDISVKVMLYAELVERLIDQLHRVVRAHQNTGTQKKSFDIIAPVKFHGKGTDLIRSERGTRNVIHAVVLAIGTVEDTFVGKKDL